MSADIREEYQFDHSKANRNRFAGELSAGRTSTMRQVLIYPGEDGYWVAECPSLPGCISQGKTKEAAVENIKDAIEQYIAALKEDNL